MLYLTDCRKNGFLPAGRTHVNTQWPLFLSPFKLELQGDNNQEAPGGVTAGLAGISPHEGNRWNFPAIFHQLPK
jgi:hypothetical protein